MRSCPKCNSDFFVKSGKVKESQRYKCKDCGTNFTTSLKSNSPLLKQIDKIYEKYETSEKSLISINKNLLKSNKTFKPISKTTLYKWFDPIYWEKKNCIENDFYKSSIVLKNLSDLKSYIQGFEAYLRIKPLKNRAKVQLIINNTSPKEYITLFTLSSIRERIGVIYCTVHFNFLNILRKSLKNIEIEDYFEDITNETYLKIIRQRTSSSRNIVTNIELYDFIEFILSNCLERANLDSIIKFYLNRQKLKKINIKKIEKEIKYIRFEKINKIKAKKYKP